MIKTICLCLIAGGLLLVIIGIIRFFTSGSMNIYKDLKTTQKVQLDMSVETVATNLYYNEILKKKQEKAEQQPVHKKVSFQQEEKKRVNIDTSALYERERDQRKNVKQYPTGKLEDMVFGTAKDEDISCEGTDILTEESYPKEVSARKQTETGTDILEEPEIIIKESNEHGTDMLFEKIQRDTDILSR